MNYQYDPYRQDCNPYNSVNGRQDPYQNNPPQYPQTIYSQPNDPQGQYPQSGQPMYPEGDRMPYLQQYPDSMPYPQDGYGYQQPYPQPVPRPKPAPEKERQTEPEHPRFMMFLYGWMDALLSAMVIVVLIFTFLFRSVLVDGPSMNPTLQDQDKLIITSMFYKPSRGDIVIIKPTEKMPEKSLIKRVIGLPGDEIEISERTGGQVYINGTLLEPENYIQSVIQLNPGEEYILTVPEGSVFVLGDNRNNSIDSRSASVDLVDDRCLMGKAIMRISPNLQIFWGPSYIGR